MNSTSDAYKYFVDKVATIARGYGKTPVQWVEVFENFGSELDDNTVIHVWKDKSTLQEVVEAGYKVSTFKNI